MSNFYFKKNREIRSRRKGESRLMSAFKPVSGVKNSDTDYRSGVHIKENLGTVERFKSGRGRSRRDDEKALRFGSGFWNVFSTVLILLLLLFLFFSFFMQGSHIAFKRLSRTFIQNQLAVFSLIGKEGDFSKSFILKADSDNEDLDYLFGNTRIRLDLDTISKTKISRFYLNYLGQDVVDLTTTYHKGRLGLQSTTSEEKDYFTTDIDRFITAVTKVDLNLKANLDAGVGKATKQRLLRKYSKILLSLADSKNVSVSKNREMVLDALDTEFRGKIYTLKPSAKEIESMLLELGNTIRKDEDLRKFLKSSGMELDLLASGSYNIVPANAFTSARDVDVMVSDFSDYLVDNAKTIANELETGGFRCEMGVQSNRIGFIGISFEDSSGFAKSFVFESAIREKTIHQAYVFSDGKSSSVITLRNSFLVEKNRVKGDAVVSVNESAALDIRYDFDKSKKTLLLPEGEYRLHSSRLGVDADLHIAGYSPKQKEYRLDVKRIDEAGEDVGSWSLELTEEDIPKLSLPEEKPRDMDIMPGSEYQSVLDSLEKGVTDKVLALMGYPAGQ